MYKSISRVGYQILIEHRTVIGKNVPTDLKRETKITVHNHQLAQATSIQGRHIQQNELRIEVRDRDDMVNYQS